MNIGIVIYSQTGNTASVALRLQQELMSAGHSVQLVRLTLVAGSKPQGKNIQFDKIPDLSEDDALVFGSPVQGFSLAPAMKSYLSQIASLQGKSVGLLITQSFPYPWMGGKQAMSQLRASCQQKGATVGAMEIINWSSSRRERQITDGIARLTNFF